MFYGMHRQPGPRTRGDVFVVKRMGELVQRPPVKPSMNKVKIRRAPEWQKDEKKYEPDGVGLEIVPGKIAVSVAPHKGYLPQCPERSSTDQAPENVVPHLVVE